MTTILRLYSDADRFNGVNLPDALWNDAIEASILEGRAVQWGDVEAIPYRDADRIGQPIGDLVGFLPALPVVSARVAEFLRQVQPDGSKFYPVRVRDMKYFLWSVQAFTAALDLSKSVLKVLPSGSVANVKVYAFIESAIVHPYFKLPQMGINSPVYIRDDLQRAIAAEGFTGFGAAKPVWSSDG
jgi:hypothetical protein